MSANNFLTPPNNIDAERAVLGAVLIDNSSFIKIADILKPFYFYDPKHEILFDFMVQLYTDNTPIDVLTLSSELKKKNKYKQAGGATYLSELLTAVPTSANIEDYAKLVKEAAMRRELIRFAAKLQEKAMKQEDNIEDIMDELETNLLTISQDNVVRDFFDSETLLDMQMERADEYAKNPNALRGLPTGLTNLDEILGGLHKSDLIIIAARPSVGKSAFGFDILRNIAVHAGKTVAIFSLEMPGVQVMERMLAQQIQVDLWKLRMGGMSDDEYRKYNMGQAKLADSKIFIDDTPGINIMQLRSKARKLMMEDSLDIILVDYLQLMQGSSRNVESRTQEVGEISRSLKLLARELNIPVIALSQLNRAVENRNENIPQLSDLRESGSIEQDADLVMFLSRKMDPEEDSDEKDKRKHIDVTVTVAKHRNGPVGSVPLTFFGAHQKFFVNKK